MTACMAGTALRPTPTFPPRNVEIMRQEHSCLLTAFAGDRHEYPCSPRALRMRGMGVPPSARRRFLPASGLRPDTPESEPSPMMWRADRHIAKIMPVLSALPPDAAYQLAETASSSLHGCLHLRRDEILQLWYRNSGGVKPCCLRRLGFLFAWDS